MELLTQNLDASLSVLQTMSGALSVPQGGGGTNFADAGNGNIVITSTQLTATDNGGNIEIEG